VQCRRFRRALLLLQIRGTTPSSMVDLVAGEPPFEIMYLNCCINFQYLRVIKWRNDLFKDCSPWFLDRGEPDQSPSCRSGRHLGHN
jgi:hypothetical protein